MELSELSENASLIFSQALDAHKVSDCEVAQKLYQNVLEIEPDHSEANHNLGIIFAKKNECEKALKLFNNCLQKNPNVSLYWASYIDTLIQVDRICEAATLVEAARESGLFCGEISSIYQRLQLGTTEPGEMVIKQLNTLLDEHKFDAVMAECLRLETIYPNSSILFETLGNAYLGQKKLKLAIPYFAKATQCNPHWSNFSLIPLIGPKLTSTDCTHLLNIAHQNMSIISELQFLYILQLATFKSEFRDEAFGLIQSFIETKGIEKLERVLAMENRLAISVLKKFENQESYAIFYKIFEDFYNLNRIGPIREVASEATGVLFFVHCPVFMAHTNPLFSILKTKRKNEKVTVASTLPSRLFKGECERLGCEFIELQGNGLLEKLKHLELCGAEHKSVVWQCDPVFLSYFSKRLPNVNWWSFKFNPPISGIKKYITALPSNADFMLINGNQWFNFTPPFEMANKNKSPVNWRSREGIIGAFCREELIDDEKYWAVLSHLLKCRNTLTFRYCGRQPIHEKWVARFEIDPNQIVFLGWLSNPQEEILKVALLLDTYTLRHGLMAREASIAGIPIIYPVATNQFGGIDALYRRLPPGNTLQNPLDYSSFDTNDSALTLIDQFAFNAVKNMEVGLQQKELSETLQSSDFAELLQLL